jgi:hypothetical protein
VSSPSSSSSASNEEGGSDVESLKDVPFRSASVTDIPDAADLVFNVSHHSEPDSREKVRSSLETESVYSLLTHMQGSNQNNYGLFV